MHTAVIARVVWTEVRITGIPSFKPWFPTWSRTLTAGDSPLQHDTRSGVIAAGINTDEVGAGRHRPQVEPE